MNVFTLLDQTAMRFPDRAAVFSGTDQVSTFAQLRTRALQIAASLRARFAPGDRIAIASENRPEYVELFFGIWAAGMAATPVNAKLHAREMVQILEDSGAAAVFVSPKLAEALEACLAGSAAAGCTRFVIGGDAWAALFGAAWDGPIEADPAGLAWLFYTSGTTGRSKGAMLSHRNILAMTLAHLADIEDLDETASIIHAAPMSHGSGLYVPAYISRGARQVVPASGGFHPDEFFALCEVHPNVGAFFAPTMVQRLRVAAESTGTTPRNLARIVYGGGPMYLEEIRRSLRVFGPMFTQIYGQGEAPMTITGLRRRDFADEDESVLGSVGWPRSGVEVRLVDADGAPVATGEVGEVVCRGDVVMSGYWNNPAATASALRDGWLYTGDMGSFDARGLLTLRDRSKDVIISGGTNIYPREVEEALLTHPQVDEVCVIGQKHSEWGEIVVAVIVPAGAAALDEADLGRHCERLIARFKRPKRYLFVESLPKSNYGKVLKRELREQLLPLEA